MAFNKATRAGTKALIELHGDSGAGKTYGALLLARGLVGPDGNVFMIDTENRRGEMYADEIDGGYLVNQLNQPFSSARYADAIAEAEKAAGDRPAALVIDSFSHEWEGEGGVLSAANTISEDRAKRYGSEWNGSVQFGDWKLPKQAHKEMVLRMLGSKLHIICCLRAQYKSRQIDRKDYEKHGITAKTKSTIIRDEYLSPIQDSNFIYEMTVGIELRNTNCGVPILTKCPKMLLPAFDGGQITYETGAKIGAWCAGGSPASQELLDSVDAALIAASQGKESYSAWWKDQSQITRAFHVENGHQAACITAAKNHDNPPTSSEDDGT